MEAMKEYQKVISSRKNDKMRLKPPTEKEAETHDRRFQNYRSFKQCLDD